ncbi:MAG: alanine racemase [Propionicimonas sp.]|uniref:alanine racemase n=1 Tax=Propionicimonas sp. TaxID=1955623 RepID=UPI003D1091DD
MGSTPFLRLDDAVLTRNIRAMADAAAALGVSLRPHAKTHKCPQVARLQVDAGAVGLTVATIGEAEVFAGAGFDDLFIAYPLWVDADAADRLRTLGDRGVRLAVGCDSAEAATNLAGLPVEVLVEVDSGHHRTGVAPASAGDLAVRIADLGLAVRGAFTFPGHSYAPDGRSPAATDEGTALATAGEAMAASGVPAQVLSGGSTPSAEFVEPGVLTELRPGVYALGDAQQVELGTIGFEGVALTVAATVVSHAGGRVVTDAGSKALGADRAPWASGYGRVLAVPDARIVALSEHHSTIEWPDALPGLGTQVLLVPNHVCNAVNLADTYHLADGGTWPIAARGRNC